MNSEKLEDNQTAKPDAVSGGKKNSTADAPMVALGEVIEFIRVVHDKGLERAPMPKVAEGTGYASASSTPFYRRVAAARLFTLLGARGADLSELGQDCIKPTSDDATHRALVSAIQSVAAYEEPLAQYNGKKINQNILANWFERKLELSEAAAASCAKAFIDSLRYAGALSAENLLNFTSESRPEHLSSSTTPASVETALPRDSKEPSEEGFRFELILDPKSRRKFVVFSPSTVTSAELKRIQDWLSFQLLVADSSD